MKTTTVSKKTLCHKSFTDNVGVEDFLQRNAQTRLYRVLFVVWEKNLVMLEAV